MRTLVEERVRAALGVPVVEGQRVLEARSGETQLGFELGDALPYSRDLDRKEVGPDEDLVVEVGLLLLPLV